MNFSDEDKVSQDFAPRIPFGVTKVQLTTVVADTTDAGKDFIELGIVTADGIEDTARVWFVGGAVSISFNTLKQIIVHNAKGETAKERARKAVDSTQNEVELADLMREKTVGGELWFTKYYDPKRTYSGQDGTPRRSINRNIYGYEPKVNQALLSLEQYSILDDIMPGSKVVPDSEIRDVPFEDEPKKTITADSTIPDDDAWAK